MTLRPKPHSKHALWITSHMCATAHAACNCAIVLNSLPTHRRRQLVQLGGSTTIDDHAGWIGSRRRRHPRTHSTWQRWAPVAFAVGPVLTVPPARSTFAYCRCRCWHALTVRGGGGGTVVKAPTRRRDPNATAGLELARSSIFLTAAAPACRAAGGLGLDAADCPRGRPTCGPAGGPG